MMKHFDHDGNGTVDYMEVKAALMTPSRGLRTPPRTDARSESPSRV